jgi:hypothetical protein
MQAAGLDTSELVAARRQLMNERIAQDGPMFLGAPLPRPPPVQTDGTQRLRHLLITEPSRV